MANIQQIHPNDSWVLDSDNKVIGVQTKNTTAEFGNVTGTTDPLTGKVTLNANGETIEVGSTPEQIGFRKPLMLGFAGDSIANSFASETTGQSPIFWAAFESYPCDFKVVMNTAVGGTSSSHLISNQIATLESLTEKPDVVFVQTLQNDYIGTLAHADTYFANVQAYSERALVAGVKLVVIGAHPPKSSSPDVASAICYLNRKIEEYCRNTTGNYFFDVFSAWRRTNAADTSGVNWRGTAYGADAFSDDGTHPTGLAAREAAKLITPLLQRYARPISPRPTVAVAYDNVNWRYNNLFGVNGLMIGTSGQYNGVNNTNVPGNSTGAYDRWFLTDGNGITATPAIVTGSDGYRYLELTMAGTASADAVVSLTHNFIQNVDVGAFLQEAVIETASLTGIKYILFSCQGLTTVQLGMTAGSNSAQFNFGTGRFLLRSQVVSGYSNSGAANKANSISIAVKNGATVSGTIRIGRVGIHRI